MSSDIGRRAWVTKCTCWRCPACPILTPPRYPYVGEPATSGQLAWLTDDMLNASIRSGGIAVLVK
jgi:hypothetical protein